MSAGGVKAIAAGGQHSMVLKNNGEVWGTGLNGPGQLGIEPWVGHQDGFVFVIGTWGMALGNTLLGLQ